MALQKEILGTGTLDINHYFLCNYVPVAAGRDGLSRSLLRFKNHIEVDLTAWVECSVDTLSLSPFILPSSVIIRALNHDERVHTYSALDHIGVKLAEALSCSYEPRYMEKSRESPAMKTLNRSDRIKALKDVYQLKGFNDQAKKDFLILDDILTTGATVAAIIHAIKDKIPSASINVFTLAKVDYDTQMNELTTFEGANFRWQGGNWEVREEEAEYHSLSALKHKILTDSF